MSKAYTKIDNDFRNECLEELQMDCEKKISVLDGFEDCLLYYSEDEDGNRCAVYCYEDLVESFAKKNKCSYTEAVEFVDIHRIDPTFSTLDDSYFSDDDE